MRTSCINHPSKEPLIVIHHWQVELCEGNTTAAALLSFFEYWHNIKSEMRSRTSRSNDIAEIHGDKRVQDETLLQFHTEEELISGIMIAKRDTIRKALSYLSDAGFISIHSNPNPKYAFDKTRYFLFHPEPINQWLREKRPPAKDPLTKSKNQHGKVSSENRQRRAESRPTQSENHSAITETSSETSPEITNPPLTPQRGEEGVHESNADDFRQEEEGEAIVVEAEIVTEEEIQSKIRSSAENENQTTQSINSNPGGEICCVPPRDNNVQLSKTGRKQKAKPPQISPEQQQAFLDAYLAEKPSNFIKHSKLLKGDLKSIEKLVQEYGDKAFEMFVSALVWIREREDGLWYKSATPHALSGVFTNDKIPKYFDKHRHSMENDPRYRARVNGEAPSKDKGRVSPAVQERQQRTHEELRKMMLSTRI